MTAARAAPSTVAIHLAESRSRLPAVLQYSCTSSRGDTDGEDTAGAATAAATRAGHAGQITLSGSRPTWHRFQGSSPQRTCRVIRCPSGQTLTVQSTTESPSLPSDVRKVYSADLNGGFSPLGTSTFWISSGDVDIPRPLVSSGEKSTPPHSVLVYKFLPVVRRQIPCANRAAHIDVADKRVHGALAQPDHLVHVSSALPWMGVASAPWRSAAIPTHSSDPDRVHCAATAMARRGPGGAAMPGTVVAWPAAWALEFAAWYWDTGFHLTRRPVTCRCGGDRTR
jgi:hypothetical protein